MTQPDNRLRPVSPAESEAYAWIARLTSGKATVADADALKAWCAASPEHQAAFAKAQRLWHELGAVGQTSRWESLPEATHRRPLLHRRAFIGGALAAPAALAVLAIWRPPLGLWPSMDELRSDYRTATGERRQVRLSSQALVEMDAQTSIRLREPATARIAGALELVAGRAGVQTESGRSFAVYAGNACTVIEAGRADVRRKGDQAQVSCLAGRVVLQHGESNDMVLGPRQQVVYERYSVGAITEIDPDEVSAWQHGVLVFRQTSLAQVVDELNRYRAGRVLVLNERTAGKTVSGRFRIDDTEAVIEQLKLALGLEVHRYPAGLVVLT